MSLVTVTSPFAYDLNGIQVVVMPDQVFEDTDPEVVQNPRAGWVPVTRSPKPFVDPVPDVRVEQASAAPGEQRNARRHR